MIFNICSHFTKIIGCVLFVLLFSHVTLGESVPHIWFDGTLKTRFQLDFGRKTFLIEKQPGDWADYELKGLATLDSTLFPPSCRLKSAATTDGKRLVCIEGTGYTYELDLIEKSIRRVDNTFFRGYNFGSTIFFRKDTLLAIGGEGFWLKHGVVTFYIKKLGEYELYPVLNIGPDRILEHFSGYSPSDDVFYTTYIQPVAPLPSNGNYIPHFFALHFKSKKWIDLGEIVHPYIRSMLRNHYEVQWVDKFFILDNNEEVYIVDPFNNKVYVPHLDNKLFFLGRSQVYYADGSLYSYYYAQSNDNILKRDSVKIDELIRMSEYDGEIYESNPLPFNLMYFLGGLLIIGSGTFLFFKLKKGAGTNTVIPVSPIDQVQDGTFLFSEMEHVIINYLKEGASFLTVNQLNDLLNISSKTLDNQRKIRTRFIQDLNDKFLRYYGISDGIERIPDPTDKRVIRYFLKSEVRLKVLPVESSS